MPDLSSLEGQQPAEWSDQYGNRYVCDHDSHSMTTRLVLIGHIPGTAATGWEVCRGRIEP